MTDDEMLAAIEKVMDIKDLKHSAWNPLVNDDTAFKLVVVFKITVAVGDKSSLALARPFYSSELHNGNPLAATRRAIVRVAAMIVKSLP